MKDKSHVLISVDAEKALGKIQNTLTIMRHTMDTKVTYLNIMKAIYDKPIAKMCNGQKLKAFLLRSDSVNIK